MSPEIKFLKEKGITIAESGQMYIISVRIAHDNYVCYACKLYSK